MLSYSLVPPLQKCCSVPMTTKGGPFVGPLISGKILTHISSSLGRQNFHSPPIFFFKRVILNMFLFKKLVLGEAPIIDLICSLVLLLKMIAIFRCVNTAGYQLDILIHLEYYYKFSRVTDNCFCSFTLLFYLLFISVSEANGGIFFPKAAKHYIVFCRNYWHPGRKPWK